VLLGPRARIDDSEVPFITEASLHATRRVRVFCTDARTSLIATDLPGSRNNNSDCNQNISLTVHSSYASRSDFGSHAGSDSGTTPNKDWSGLNPVTSMDKSLTFLE